MAKTLFSALLAGMFLASLQFTFADEKSKSQEKKQLKIGDPAPSFVVDFALGPHEGSGCPFVMIGNQKKGLGIVFLANGCRAEYSASALAKALNAKGMDPKKVQGFIVTCDPAFWDLKEDHRMQGIAHFGIGVPQESPEKVLESLGFPEEERLVIFLVEGKKIASIHSCNKPLDDFRKSILPELMKFAGIDPDKK